jgi:hypothetical protein
MKMNMHILLCMYGRENQRSSRELFDRKDCQRQQISEMQKEVLCWEGTIYKKARGGRDRKPFLFFFSPHHHLSSRSILFEPSHGGWEGTTIDGRRYFLVANPWGTVYWVKVELMGPNLMLE